MKTKILITAMSLDVGGAEKSLVNLLNMIDYNKYEIDLLLFQCKGIFLKQVPKEVKIKEVEEINLLFNSFKYNPKSSLSFFNILKLAIIRPFTTIYEKLKWKQFDQIRLHRWIDFYKKLIPNYEREYDLAIAYAGGETAYYIFDKVKSKRKIYYFHSDYSKIDIDKDLEYVYTKQSDLIVTISQRCKESLDMLFPKLKEKIVVLQNLSSSRLICNLANESIDLNCWSENKCFKIISIGRLVNIKGFDMAIDAAALLKRKNINFEWIIIGDGEEKKKLEKQIAENNLNKNVKLMGVKENPYVYLSKADLLVQSSRFEGKSVVLDEAKILEIPVLVTNYNSVTDQIKNNVDGIIVEMSADGIFKGILDLIKNSYKLDQIKQNIKNKKIDTEAIDEYMNVLLNGNNKVVK